MAKLRFYRWILKIEGRLTGVTVWELSDEEIERRESGTRSLRVSPAQQEQRERFKQAAVYALAVMSDPDLHAVYVKKAARKRANPYTMAMTDYLKGRDLPLKE
jgi:hypothetical protein